MDGDIFAECHCLCDRSSVFSKPSKEFFVCPRQMWQCTNGLIFEQFDGSRVCSAVSIKGDIDRFVGIPEGIDGTSFVKIDGISNMQDVPVFICPSKEVIAWF